MAEVIVIDDDDDLRVLARMALEMDGHTVIEASDGTSGLAECRAAVERGGRPLLLLDVQMPDVEGWEVLRAVRAQPGGDAIPVVLCTVKAAPLDRERGFSSGADAYLTKPFDLDNLSAIVDDLTSLPVGALIGRRADLADYLAGTED